jgi:hypothetical protein
MIKNSFSKGIIHRRQFVISKTGFEHYGFLTISMENGYMLSYQKELNVTRLGDGNYLLGYAFSCETIGGVYLSGNVENCIRSWAGRWILVTRDSIYLDAAGTLGLFYGYDKNRNFICSSSLALLHNLVPRSRWISNIRLERGNGLFDYYPGPYTPWEGCRCVLPSEKVDLVKGVVVNRTDFDFTRCCEYTKENLIRMIIEKESIVLKNIAGRFENLYLPLTSGVDSRTILAIANRAGINLNLYTVYRLDTPIWDYKTPYRIAKKMQLPYQIFKENVSRKNDVEKELKVVYEHCGGRTTSGTELTQYINGFDVGNGNESVVLWGPLWEFGIHYYDMYYPEGAKDNTSMSDILNMIESRVGFKRLDDSRVHGLSLREWVKYVFDNPVKGLSWIDRSYWEQRVGSWVKNSQQMYDMFDSIRIIPVNCQELLEMLIAFDPDYNTAKGKEAQKEIIRQCNPKLSEIPYGEYYTIPEKAWRKGKRILRKVLRWKNSDCIH